MLKSAVVALVIAGSVAAASEPVKPPGSAATGKHVYIVDEHCFGFCVFRAWTVRFATTLRAAPDESSAVVAELVWGEQVEGIAARTITTYLPRCTFLTDAKGHRADCVKPDCKPVRFRSGDEFYYREDRGFTSLIEYRNAEFEIPNQLDIERRRRSGKFEVIGRYRCDGRAVFKTWVQVRLPNGESGWAYRENFNGTEVTGKIGGRR